MRTRLQKTFAFAAIAWVCVVIPLGGRAGAQILSVPNNSFEEGESEPKGWVLSGGGGLWTESAADGKRAICVTGTGKSGTFGTRHPAGTMPEDGPESGGWRPALQR